MKLRAKLRLAFMTAVLAGCSFGMVGCTPVAPISARLSDGRVTFVLCNEVKVSSVIVASTKTGGGATETRWQATGRGQTSGYVFTFGELPEGWLTAVEPEQFDPSSEDITVKVAGGGSSAGTNAPSFAGSFEAGAIEATKWTRADGSKSSKACEN